MSWVLKSTDVSLLNDIKLFEGTKEFQSKMGYFKGGKFVVYKDHLGYPTIGYGHLLLENEKFSSGLTESEADSLLSKDLNTSVADAKSLYDKYGMTGGIELQKVLVQMTFQMGLTKLSKFKNTLAAMGKGDYKSAASGMRNSLWYKQTTNRAEKLAKIVESL